MNIQWKQIVVVTVLAGGWAISGMAAQPTASGNNAPQVAPKEHAVKDITEKFLKQHELYQQYQHPADMETLRALAKERRVHMEELIAKDPQAFLDQAILDNIQPIPAETISGFSYSRGKSLVLSLYRR